MGGEKGCRERGGEGEKGSCRGVEVGGSRGRRRGRGRGGEGGYMCKVIEHKYF